MEHQYEQTITLSSSWKSIGFGELVTENEKKRASEMTIIIIIIVKHHRRLKNTSVFEQPIIEYWPFEWSIIYTIILLKTVNHSTTFNRY